MDCSSWTYFEDTNFSALLSLYGVISVYAGVWWGNLRERDHLEDPGLDGSSGSAMWGHGMDRAGSDRDRWQAFVNAVMNLRVP
jgi:hypothetical protein